jgi:hypothetical protein
MAEAFVRTIKRDYVRVSPCPDADTVMHQLSAWITHYNEVHPHKTRGCGRRALQAWAYEIVIPVGFN